MKKLFFAMIVCAGFCACSNDDVVVTTTPNEVLGEGVAYITVNIKDVNSGTRATDGGFAYGTTDEQIVNNAYFYLYDENDVYVAYGSLGSVDGTATTGDPTSNIEWNSGTVVAIWGLTDPTVPKKMVTVLNQPSTFSGINKDLSTLEKELAGTPWGDTTNGFVMSTSAYGSTNGEVDYTALSEANFALEPIDLTNDYGTDGATPVAVYVERLASKVGVNVSSSLTAAYTDTSIYPVSDAVLGNFPLGAPTASNPDVGGLGIQLLGFDVDGVARDAYLVKNIDTNWSLSFTWNDATDYRSYWAESPNYGVEHTYPTSSNGNTDADEDTNPLDEYLRYVSLASPVDLGGTTYCGENTNTATVLVDATSTGLTNVLVKAQFVDYNPNNSSEPVEGIDLVEYHGEYYTADQFCQKCVDDVVNYDFTIVVDEVIAALENEYPDLTTYIEDLNGAIVKDHIYKSVANENHKYGVGVNGPSEVSAFGGEMLSLYNAVDGNVKIFYNGAQPYWGENGDGTAVGSEIIEKYPAADIVYGGADLDKYDFWFHVDQTEFENFLTRAGLQAAGLLYQIDDEYFMPIDNSISFTTEAMGDDNFSGGHVYTTRNFLLRTITVEADGIDGEFGSLYPNYYKDGLMYYHVPIEHLGLTSETTHDFAEGDYGVVRNHYYSVTITSLNNLGRGIAVEDEVIVPQPEIPYYYLGATIDILSWKMINQEVGF